MAKNPNTYVAHEQFATQIKMTLAMAFSGIMAGLVIWLLILYGIHSSIAGDLKSIYIPLQLKGGRLLTFEGSGIFSSEQIAGNGRAIRQDLAELDGFLYALPGHKDFEAIKSKSIPIPEPLIESLFPFGKMILNKIVSPFVSAEPIFVNIDGKKPVRLFKEKKISSPEELRSLLPVGEYTISDFRSKLDSALAGSLSKANAKWDKSFPWTFITFPVIIFLWFFFLKKISKKKGSDKLLRGASLLLFQDFCKRLDNLNLPAGFTLGELKLPKDFETSHFLVLGTTGSGKSVLLNQILAQVNERNEKAIIYDVKGEFLSKHGKPDNKNNLIFYPFDTRSLRWSVFNEIRHKPDFDMIATALLQPPKEASDNKYWYDAARDVFRAGMLFLYLNNMRKNRDIIDFFNKPMAEIIASISSLPLEERSALKHIDGDSKPAMGVMSTLQAGVPFLRYIADQDGDFSFRNFIRDQKDRRHLYLLNIRNYEPIFKPLMTFVIDIMIREVLSLPDDREKRIFFLVDEFASLGRLSSIFDFISMARSKGGSMILANQDLGAIESLYGRPLLKTFYNNLNNKFILRIEDPETSRFLSEAFGEREIVKKMESRSMSPGDFGDRHTISDQDKIEKLILQSQFQDLKDFQAYIKLGKIGITKFKIPVKFFVENLPHFIIDKKSFDIEGIQPYKEAESPAAENICAASEDEQPKIDI